MYTVYMHTCTVNNKKYIGITCQEPWTRRFNSSDGNGYKTCTIFWKAIQKYGWDKFKHQILQICESEDDAKSLERYYIALYQTNNDKYGYNILEGGQTQRYPQSVKDKISASNKGRQSPTKGKHHSEETKRKISEAQKGRKLTGTHLENVRKANREYYKTHSPVHTFTAEDFEKAREAAKKKVRIIELDKTFNSMTDCADYLGVLVSNLSRAIRFNKKYKGYHYEIVYS